MNETKKLTLVWLLDNDQEFSISISDPLDTLTKAETDTVMQSFIDKNAILKDGRSLVEIKTAYVTTTTKEILA